MVEAGGGRKNGGLRSIEFSACFLHALFALVAAPVAALESHEHVHRDRKAILIHIDPKVEKLELFLQNDAKAPLKRFAEVNRWLAATRSETLVFGMNAGMFHADLSPVGLCVVEGKQFQAINSNEGEGNFFLKPNGVFLITTKGTPHVITSPEAAALKEPLRLATQSGPMLIRAGVLHPAFKEGSKNRRQRNGVGMDANGHLWFAITTHLMNFHEFATLFRDVAKCPDALFLDGAICSLYLPQINRADEFTDLGPIIGITVKQK